MKIAFITNVPNSIARVRLHNEAIKKGHSLSILSWKNIVLNSEFASKIADSLNGYDVVHFAGGLGNFATKEVQEILEGRGVFCPNSYTRRSFDADHKVFQTIRFVKAGLPIPKSVRATHLDIEHLVMELGWPIVSKEPDSSQGKGVRLLRSADDVAQLTARKEYLFQQYIDYEADYRVHVAGGKTFCPYRRIPPSGDFRANVSLGGRIEKVSDESVLQEINSLGVRTAKVMDLDYCAVDLIKDKSGRFFVLETNSDPGFKGVEEITGESFAAVILDYYESNLPSQLSSQTPPDRKVQ